MYIYETENTLLSADLAWMRLLTAELFFINSTVVARAELGMLQ